MDRRKWLLQSGLAITGLSLLPPRSLAAVGRVLPAEDNTSNSVINLSCNENPYGPSPLARKAMVDAINLGNRYQWDMIGKLMAAVAAKNNTTADNVVLGAGSSEILDLLIQLAASARGNVVLANPTFSRWDGAAEKLGLQKIHVPLTHDKRHDLPAMLRAVRPDTRLVYICNPNNPTGTICDYEVLVSFVAEATKSALVVVDEAYLDFTTEKSLASIAVTNKNFVVVKTFSKIYGMAGARAGYAIGHTETINNLGDIRSGANMGISAMTVAGALASLGDNEFVTNSYTLNQRSRKYTIGELERLHIPCIPSHTNFIYFSLDNYNKDFFAALKKHNIIGTGIFEEEGKWSRITVGTIQEMNQFIAAIA